MEPDTSQEEVVEQLQKLLYDRGNKALTLARKTVLDEKIESKRVRDALHYFITDYWNDVTRPALLSLVCESVGGDPELTTPVGVSMTLIAGGIDIHDDIIDESKRKGSKFTVYGKYGKKIALLVGDALMFKGFTLLYETLGKGITSDQIATMSKIINQTFFELGDAEALELDFRNREDVTPEEYLSVIRKKAADVEAHTRISAMLGGASSDEIEDLAEYGRILGMLVILRDEMIDMLDPKETIHRIKKEHLSMAILYALQNPDMKSSISNLLNQTRNLKDADNLSLLVDAADGYSKMNACMQSLANIAYKNIENAKYNKNYLALIIQGMLLPDWRSYLTPEITDR
ncbi:MAG: polyprenyl synthetase family protein [Candidatus Bathyarchaeota archaeon]|nr:polyprenyl synthetase family protein [Candidatus Bathyarchaeum tardum]